MQQDPPGSAVVEVSDSSDESERVSKNRQSKKVDKKKARKKVIRKQPTKNIAQNRKRTVAPEDLRATKPEPKKEGHTTECGMYYSYVNEQGQGRLRALKAWELIDEEPDCVYETLLDMKKLVRRLNTETKGSLMDCKYELNHSQKYVRIICATCKMF